MLLFQQKFSKSQRETISYASLNDDPNLTIVSLAPLLSFANKNLADILITK